MLEQDIERLNRASFVVISNDVTTIRTLASRASINQSLRKTVNLLDMSHLFIAAPLGLWGANNPLSKGRFQSELCNGTIYMCITPASRQLPN